MQIRMKRVALSFLFSTFLSLLLVSVFACNSEPEKIPNATIPADQPYLTTSEAIGLAKQDALAHPDWASSTKWASSYVSNGEWNAKYDGKSKWIVDLRVSSNDGATLITYHWSVLETGLKAVYVGETSERKPDISSQLSAEEVIQKVKGSVITYYYSGMVAKPIGIWTAIFKGNGIWEVTGVVETNVGGKIYQTSTVWKYNGYTIALDDSIRQ